MRDGPKDLRLGENHDLQKDHSLVGLGWEGSCRVTISVRRVCSGVSRLASKHKHKDSIGVAGLDEVIYTTCYY